jgi:hypothetical protein
MIQKAKERNNMAKKPVKSGKIPLNEGRTIPKPAPSKPTKPPKKKK